MSRPHLSPVSPSSPCTRRMTWDWTVPTALAAVQRYCPASARSTRSMVRVPSRTSTPGRMRPPTLLQVTWGRGSPKPRHSSSTMVPASTVCTAVRMLIRALGRAGGDTHTEQGFGVPPSRGETAWAGVSTGGAGDGEKRGTRGHEEATGVAVGVGRDWEVPGCPQGWGEMGGTGVPVAWTEIRGIRVPMGMGSDGGFQGAHGRWKRGDIEVSMGLGDGGPQVTKCSEGPGRGVPGQRVPG